MPEENPESFADYLIRASKNEDEFKKDGDKKVNQHPQENIDFSLNPEQKEVAQNALDEASKIIDNHISLKPGNRITSAIEKDNAEKTKDYAIREFESNKIRKKLEKDGSDNNDFVDSIRSNGVDVYEN